MYDFREIEYLKEFYVWMRENIKYGFEDINGQIHDNNLKGIREVFVTRSADDAKRTGFGWKRPAFNNRIVLKKRRFSTKN